MAEYARTEKHQFCDSELCMLLDTVTGKPERLRGYDAIIPFELALDYIKIKDGQKDRLVIVKLQCVKAFEL